MPDDPKYQEASIWLTISALGGKPETEYDAEERAENLKRLGPNDYWIQGADMLVRATDFDLGEFLGWVRVWLLHMGLEGAELIAGSAEEFAGTNQHAAMIAAVQETYPAGTSNTGE